MKFETWVDQQIREAQERGEFDNLPGKGKPIKDLHEPYDELWWIRQKLERENISYTPPNLALGKQIEDARTDVWPAEDDGTRPALDLALRLLVVTRCVGGVRDIDRNADGRLDGIRSGGGSAQADLLGDR